ncbi:hypothetical protein [Hymenobacter elongatus]|uniref:Uncharacterized protein n=1 Tax=Hymenobacter elongatus TaxID=877208 RepID=A0A4Z0PM71_9BACT|nr:hypothetical protein [Hymenobacter elongatus]TGE17560.1 hypothetical protein E5J99_06830 [Hymenobacter elongatus]
MTFRFRFLLLFFSVASPALVRAQDAPRQLNTLPTMADSARRQSQPAPQTQRQPAPPPPVVETTKFAVGLKNGTVYKAYDVSVKQPLFGRSYLLLNDQRRIDMGEVGFYEDETGHYVRTVLPRSKRETTLRRDRAGRLSLYSAITTQYTGGGYSPYGYGGRYGGFGAPMYRTVKTEYFSKDNGPVQDLNVRNLSIATADNAGSSALLMEGRKYQTYTTLSYVAAAGVLAAGLFATFGTQQSDRAISPLVYAGIPLAILPIVLGSKQQQNIKQAISLYNRGAE